MTKQEKLMILTMVKSDNVLDSALGLQLVNNNIDSFDLEEIYILCHLSCRRSKSYLSGVYEHVPGLFERFGNSIPQYSLAYSGLDRNVYEVMIENFITKNSENEIK